MMKNKNLLSTSAQIGTVPSSLNFKEKINVIFKHKL